MKASSFIRITNAEQLGVDVGELEPGEIRIVPNPALDQPDQRDPLNRTFMVFGLIWEGRLALAVQPKAEERLVSLVSPEWDVENLDSRIDSILAKIDLDGDRGPIEVRRNRLYCLDQTDSVEPVGPAVVLTKSDQTEISELAGKGPFACSEDAIDSER